MMKRLLFFLFSLAALSASSQIRLPRLVSDNAVLQRDRQLNLFGWASAGENVSLEFRGKIFSATANRNGEWTIVLPAQNAGGPFDMVFRGKNQITLRNIVFGDVWLCSGQSNMELTMQRVRDKYAREVVASENTFIRHFEVPDKYDFKNEHKDIAGGEWKEANPENVLGFSAVAYFFAIHIYEKHQVPIGLVNAALGGSPVEAWMSEDALKKFPHHLAEAIRFRNDSLIQAIEASDRRRIQDWYSKLAEKDAGVLQGWKHEPAFTTWDITQLPGYWADEKTGDINGSVWFSRTVNIPASLAGKAARLELGRIVDQDSVFINGHFVGTTGYQYPPRRYDLAPGILKEGENKITVRVINQSGRGGFVTDKPYFIAAGSDTVDLKGSWYYKVGAVMDPLPGPTFIRWKPLGLYNAMIAPLTHFEIAGVIWYQGESNTGAGEEYEALFPALIHDWRSKWDDNFPFLFVQLANFMEPRDEPMESNWARLRESQRKAQQVANTGMAVAIDAGEWNDIHPLNKKVVGGRLALHARRLFYGENIIAGSPQPEHITFEKDKVVIRFSNAKNGLVFQGANAIKHFAISSDGKQFTWAKARVKGDKVVVWSETIANPVAIRYAWADNPASANLYNKEGLPASPFQAFKNN